MHQFIHRCCITVYHSALGFWRLPSISPPHPRWWTREPLGSGSKPTEFHENVQVGHSLCHPVIAQKYATGNIWQYPDLRLLHCRTSTACTRCCSRHATRHTTRHASERASAASTAKGFSAKLGTAASLGKGSHDLKCDADIISLSPCITCNHVYKQQITIYLCNGCMCKLCCACVSYARSNIQTVFMGSLCWIC